MHGFWDKVIFSIFCIPFAIIIGIAVGWCLSKYLQGIGGIGTYLLSILASVTFTTIIAFMFPAFTSKVLTAIISL